MSGKIHIDRIPKKALGSLAPEVRAAIIEVKNLGPGALRLPEYGNAFGGPKDGPPLPKASAGCSYRERDVGKAHPNDPKGARGKRRLVFEVHAAGKIMEIFYTEEHYEKGSFARVI